MTITDDLVKAIDALVTHRVNIIINEDDEWFDELLDRKIKMKSVETEDGTLNIAITGEGIIMDHYKDGEVSSTVGMTFDEWVEWMEGH